MASALSLEDIISTRGGRALEAKTWRLSAHDPLIEDSGLQELTEGNQGCGWARPEHRRVAGRAVLASHRINPPNNLVRQLGESGTVTCRGAEQKHLGLAAAAEPARRKLSSPSVSLNFLSRQVPPCHRAPPHPRFALGLSAPIHARH